MSFPHKPRLLSWLLQLGPTFRIVATTEDSPALAWLARVCCALETLYHSLGTSSVSSDIQSLVDLDSWCEYGALFEA